MKNGSAKTKAAPPPPKPAVAAEEPRWLGVLVVLGLVSALWTAFLWIELVRWRGGVAPVCGFQEGARCGALWDSPVASTIHDATGLPVAGWGLAWSLVALALPLAALRWKAKGRPLPAELLSGIRITAAGGVVAALFFVAASASARIFCLGCAVTDLLVAGYAAIALFAWRGLGLPDAWRGLGLSGLSTAGAVTLLLYPGLQTPPPPEVAARRAVQAAGAGSLSSFVGSLSPRMKQALSDTLAAYRAAPSHPPRPRALLGPGTAPVRITTFSDVLCPHCAELHHTLRDLLAQMPPGSFQLESRQFPLDATCNPTMQHRANDPVRCLGARAQICLEGKPGAFDYTAALFENQASLTAEKVLSLAEPYLPRPELEACIGSRETQARLDEDETEVRRHAFEGTPLVLINGRQGSAFPPFLRVMILSGGDDSHPALASLPPPRVRSANAAM
jgi:protein-disulfide isomerase